MTNIKVDLDELPTERRQKMLEAGEDILECYRVMKKGGVNIVSEVLKDQGTFYEWNHYPDGDVYDPETHGQYYYHNHREGEHGHFHLFLRKKGMTKGVKPVPYKGKEAWPKGTDALSHLVAISMDDFGFPLALFTTNRWVTAENWYKADDVIPMLDVFMIDHAFPSWPVNRWLTAMVTLFQPQISELVHRRDKALVQWQLTHAKEDAFEDRDLEIMSDTLISIEDQISALRDSLAEG